MMKFITLFRQRYAVAFFMAFPALIGLIFFHYWPIFEMARLSFLDFKIFTGEFSWIGADNYAQILDDDLFFRTFKTTLLFFVLKVPLQMILALALALFVKEGGRSIGLVRTIILLPAVTAMVVASTVWGFMFHPNNGLVNSFLTTVGLAPQLFLASADQALPSIVFITIWKSVGLNMLFFLSGLMMIPKVYYEAVTVDGANRWQTFRHVTLPLLRGTTIFVLVTSTIAAFKVFVPVKILTDGGPQSATRVIVLYIFELAFRYNRLGYASTISVILALILLCVSIFQLRVSQDGEES